MSDLLDPMDGSKTSIKQLKLKYGRSLGPIECTRAFMRVMPFDHNGISAVSYILVNDVKNVRTHVNLYDGRAGVGFDPKDNSYPIGKLERKLKGYVEISVDKCPIAVKVGIDERTDEGV